jgi:Spy/CpxP family protein refolding chaperone
MFLLLLCVLLLGGVAMPLAAQDSGPPHRERMRERVEQRFAERIRAELDLTDEQAARLREVARENGGRRRALRQRERALSAALDAQLRAGERADQDSVARLTRAMLDLRVEYAENWREEMRRLSFLTPVQRARLMVMRDRLLERVHQMRRDRRGYRHGGGGD